MNSINNINKVMRPIDHSGRVIEENELGEGDVSYGRIKPEGVDTAHGAILYLEDITVSFDGFKAINNLNLDISVGELRCIIGPNGAGKTTMMDVITGKTRPTSGTVFFGQSIDLTKMTEYEIAHAGIGRKFEDGQTREDHSVCPSEFRTDRQDR